MTCMVALNGRCLWIEMNNLKVQWTSCHGSLHRSQSDPNTCSSMGM